MKNFLKTVFLFLFVIASYSSAIHGKYLWDDSEFVAGNPLMGQADGLRKFWCEPCTQGQYYPMSHTAFWIQHKLWGGHFPEGYHLFNILLHFVNSVLVWFVLMRLGLLSAYGAALIFAVHPVHAESVAWISEIKNVLSGMFYLTAMFFFWDFLLKNRRGSYVISILSFTLAMLSKTVACTLPVAMLVLVWWKNKRITRTDILRMLPFFGVGLLLGLVTIRCEKLFISDTGQQLLLSWMERWLVVGRAVWFYPTKLLWPADLSFIYPRWNIDPGEWWQHLFPFMAVLTLGLMIRLAVVKKKGHGLLAGTLFYLITIAPALGFFDVETMRYTFVADHYQYLASLGLIVLFSEGMYRLKERYKVSQARLAIALAGLLAVFSFLTYQQGKIYTNKNTLYTDIIKKNPGCWLAYNNRGSLFWDHRLLDLAMADFNKAIAINPDYARAYNNRGWAYFNQGLTEQALSDFNKTIALAPRFWAAYNNRGMLYHEQGLYAQAIADFDQAIHLGPDNSEPYYNRAMSYILSGRMDQAYQDLLKARELGFTLEEGYLKKLESILRKSGNLP